MSTHIPISDLHEMSLTVLQKKKILRLVHGHLKRETMCYRMEQSIAIVRSV